jgi:thiol-disulfide isomerase/thioredoxin
MEPLMEQLKTDCAGLKVKIRQVDLSNPANAPLSKKHRVVGVPTFVFLDDKGKEVARLVGRQSLKNLRQHLSLLTGTSCPDVGQVPGSASSAAFGKGSAPRPTASPEAAGVGKRGGGETAGASPADKSGGSCGDGGTAEGSACTNW